jgi:hypothetical protein
LHWRHCGITPAFAKTAEDTPEAPKSAAEWVQEWTIRQKNTSVVERGFALLSRCAVVEKKGKAFKFIPVDPAPISSTFHLSSSS